MSDKPRCPECGSEPVDWHKNIRSGWCRKCDHGWDEKRVAWLRASHAKLLALLTRCLPIVVNDAMFQDSIIRHMPLPPKDQAEFEANAASDQLEAEIREALEATHAD